jgi:hypothetical protein
MVSSIQWLDHQIAATNGANGIPSAIRDQSSGGGSMTGALQMGVLMVTSTTSAIGPKKICELSITINKHGKKMVSVAKMKCDQWEKELSYAKQAEICNSICTLGSEKRQLIIQMQGERAKKNEIMEQVYADVIAEIEEKLEHENALMIESTMTPQKSNRSPSTQFVFVQGNSVSTKDF